MNALQAAGRAGVTLVCAAMLGGCANPARVFRDSQAIPFKAYPDQGKAAIYLWEPFTSAAIVDSEGNRCVMAASGAQSLGATASAALKASDVAGKLGNLDAAAQSAINHAFNQISQPDSRSAALDIALFHLCILDQNGTFKDVRGMPDGHSKGHLVMKAYLQTVEKAMGMAPAPAAPPATAHGAQAAAAPR